MHFQVTQEQVPTPEYYVRLAGKPDYRGHIPIPNYLHPSLLIPNIPSHSPTSPWSKEGS